MNASEIPDRLMEILDRRAGKRHSRQGPVARCLAEILTEYEQMLNSKTEDQEERP